MRQTILSAILVLAFSTAAQTNKITAAEAKDHSVKSEQSVGKWRAHISPQKAKVSLHF